VICLPHICKSINLHPRVLYSTYLKQFVTLTGSHMKVRMSVS